MKPAVDRMQNYDEDGCSHNSETLVSSHPNRFIPLRLIPYIMWSKLWGDNIFKNNFLYDSIR